MKDKAFSLEDKNIISITKCLSEAIGDDVKGCLRRENLNEKRSNGKKLLKWDFINRNFIMNFSAGNLTAEYAKRGAWNMVPLYDKETGTIYTVMREERFREIQRKQPKRKKAHYVGALVQSFNFDLNTEHQLSLFEEQSFDEEEVKSIVDDIIKDFDIEKTVIKRYKTVLFEEYNSELIAVRCCVLDSSLQVVEEEDWSTYITHSESVVVDTVADSNEPHTSNIKLKDKARKKAGQRELVALKENSQEQKVQNN